MIVVNTETIPGMKIVELKGLVQGCGIAKEFDNRHVMPEAQRSSERKEDHSLCYAPDRKAVPHSSASE